MTDEECSSLDVWRGADEGGNHRIISFWKPSYEDLQALNAGGGIYLDIYSIVQPVVSLYVESPFKPTE